MSITIATDGMIRFFEAESEVIIEVPLKTKIRKVPTLTGQAKREPKLEGKVRSIRLHAKVNRCDT